MCRGSHDSRPAALDRQPRHTDCGGLGMEVSSADFALRVASLVTPRVDVEQMLELSLVATDNKRSVYVLAVVRVNVRP